MSDSQDWDEIVGASICLMNLRNQKVNCEPPPPHGLLVKKLSKPKEDQITNLGKRKKKGLLSSSRQKYQYSNSGFSGSLEEVYAANPDLFEAAIGANHGRVIARQRVFKNGTYTSWEYVHSRSAHQPSETSTSSSSSWTCLLQRGGVLTMHLNRVDNYNCATLKHEIEECHHLKVYPGNGIQLEPRVHALASNLAGGGYKYNTTKMKAFSLDEVPRVQELAQCLAQEHLIDDWTIGVDLLTYRGGNDSMGWHQDNTQEESIVLCAVVHVGKHTRSLCIQPNTAPVEGDEQIEIYPGPGDVYQMDGTFLIIYFCCTSLL